MFLLSVLKMEFLGLRNILHYIFEDHVIQVGKMAVRINVSHEAEGTVSSYRKSSRLQTIVSGYDEKNIIYVRN
jgi:hypothetical protein